MYLERSPSLLVALLAVLKAGGAFVAFDRKCPAEHLELMQREAKVGSRMICKSERDLPAGLRVENVVSLSAHREVLDAGNLGVVPSPRNTAYMVFTSGSSGRPKGVVLEHGGLADYVRAITATSRWASTTSISTPLPSRSLRPSGSCSSHSRGEPRSRLHRTTTFKPWGRSRS